MRLPIEIRWMIYQYMLTITRGTQRFIAHPNGMTFCTRLDFSYPWIATLCPDMFHFIFNHAHFEKVSFRGVILHEPLYRSDVWIPPAATPFRSLNVMRCTHLRYLNEGWFSAKHDTVEVEYMSSPRWLITRITPYARIPNAYKVRSVLEGSNSYPLLPPRDDERNSLHDVLDAKTAEARLNSQPQGQPNDQQG